MLFGAWVFVGVVAIIATLGSVLTTDAGEAFVAGVAGAITWGVWTFGTLNIERPIEGNPSLEFGEPALTLVGLALALVPSYMAIVGVTELTGRVRDTDMREV